MRTLFFLGFLTTVLSSAQQGQLPVVHPGTVNPPVLSSSLPRFEDVGQQAGLSVSHISSPDKRYIIESVSGGIDIASRVGMLW